MPGARLYARHSTGRAPAQPQRGEHQLSTDHDAESVLVAREVTGTAVDPPDRKVTFADITATRPRRPIVPAWMRSPAQRREASRWALGYGTHTVVYHLTRTPKYLVKVAWYAPKGLVVGAVRLVWWARAEEGNWTLRQAAATRDDADTWLKLASQRTKESGPRQRGVALAALGVVAACGLLVATPDWVRWLAAAAAALLLARLGQPVGKPIVDRVHLHTGYRKLTADLVRKAIVATGEVKDPGSISFPHEIHRDGPGYLAIVDLPDGVVATDIIDKRDYLAGGLRLPVDQVWPETIRGEHPGRVHIWVADRPVSSMKTPEWPLLREGTVDYFKPFPYGFDPRQRPVLWRLDERNTLAGGVPGSGKSLAGRVVVCGAVLDPLVLPAGFDLKGTGDFDPFEDLCPPGMYGSGADERTKARADAMLDWLLDECERRGPLIKQYVRRGYSTENKLNRAMAEADPRLRPIVAWIDEAQELFTDPELGKPAQAKATSIVKRGRALGIHLILMTQRIDKESIPKGISSNIVMRLCLAVTSHIETDLVLGTGAYKTGARPTQFEPGVDAGWGWRVGMGKPGPVRAAYLDNAAVAAVVGRAKALRGDVEAPADPVVPQARNLVADLLRVWPAGEDRMWSEVLVPLLAELDPQAYGELTVEGLNAMLRAAGVEPGPLHRKVDGKGVTRYGVRLDAIADSGTRVIEGGEKP